MKAYVFLLRVWPLFIQFGFCWSGWHISRSSGTVMAPTLFIGTEREGDLNIFVVLLLFFAVSVGWKR